MACPVLVSSCKLYRCGDVFPGVVPVQRLVMFIESLMNGQAWGPRQGPGVVCRSRIINSPTPTRPSPLAEIPEGKLVPFRLFFL